MVVCRGDAVYESSPDLCANGLDGDGDKLVDCDEPDCRAPAFGPHFLRRVRLW